MDEDFTKALQSSQAMPELPDELTGAVPDIFAGAAAPTLVTKYEPDVEGKVPGGKEYHFDYNCTRLMIGQIQTGFSKGTAEYTKMDDSERLKEIMDMHLRGEAIVHNKQETFLKDGTVVIWLEWLLPRKPTPKKDRDWMTLAELTSPEPKDKEADDSGDAVEGF